MLDLSNEQKDLRIKIGDQVADLLQCNYDTLLNVNEEYGKIDFENASTKVVTNFFLDKVAAPVLEGCNPIMTPDFINSNTNIITRTKLIRFFSDNFTQILDEINNILSIPEE